jgi:hypothetical protein
VGTDGKKANDPADVAREGFEALMAGKDHVIAASFMTKLQGLMARLLPEPVLAKNTRKQSEPGSAEPERRKSA